VAKLFGPGDTSRFRVALLSVPTLLVAVAVVWGVVYRSSYYTGVDTHLEQPVPFSHQHHVSGLGLDCRYCHTTVEVSQDAGIPPTHICMTCHSQIWTNAEILAPVRQEPCR
jgi:hypothetical protein